MSTAVAIAGGLGASTLFATGTALQYRTAGELEVGTTIDVRSVARLARAMVSSRKWVLGAVVLAAGLGLHALALHQGPLTLVQPLLISGVLLTLPTSRLVGGPAVTAADMRWAAVLVAALIGFLVAATPASKPSFHLDAGPAAVTVLLSGVGIAACLVVAQRFTGNATATVLGVAAGIALAGSAALLKVTGDLLGGGITAILASWQLYALLAVGASGFLLTQLAYRAGPMAASLPAINSANPLMSMIIGTAVFDERFRAGAAALVAEALSLGVVLVATAALSRRSAQPSAGPDAKGQNNSPTAGRAPGEQPSARGPTPS